MHQNWMTNKKDKILDWYVLPFSIRQSYIQNMSKLEEDYKLYISSIDVKFLYKTTKDTWYKVEQIEYSCM